MKKLTVPLGTAATAVLLTLAVTTSSVRPA